MSDNLEKDQKLITVSYDSFQHLLSREETIKQKLEDDLNKQDTYVITNQYISVDEKKYYLNFVITPKYRA